MKINLAHATRRLSWLVKEALGRGLSGRGRLEKFAGDIDAAFTPAVEAAVARLLQGEQSTPIKRV